MAAQSLCEIYKVEVEQQTCYFWCLGRWSSLWNAVAIHSCYHLLVGLPCWPEAAPGPTAAAFSLWYLQLLQVLGLTKVWLTPWQRAPASDSLHLKVLREWQGWQSAIMNSSSTSQTLGGPCYLLMSMPMSYFCLLPADFKRHHQTQ